MNRRALAACLVALPAAPAWAQAWRPVERVETYAVAGTSGIALYRSIGERGPRAGGGRAIATTTFRLTWKRDYREADGACTLAAATPKLVVTTLLPKPAQPLDAATRARWDRFVAGIAAHEKVHAADIVAMVEKIEAATVGLSVPDDPGCTKLRQQMTVRLKALSDEQQARSRAFDRAEMGRGGTVERLVLALVNP